MSKAAIDASALIAFLRSEPGADVVERHLPEACMSAVNLSEVLEKAPKFERSVKRILALLHNWQVEVISFDRGQAAIAAELKGKIGEFDISFADRVCLALAISRSIPAVTADRAWMSLPVETEVILIRGEPN